MRNLLKEMNEKYVASNKPEYLENLKRLGEYCPELKKDELEKVIKIV